MSEIKAVVFDVDGTLTKKNSWQTIALAMGATWEEDLEIYHAEKAGKLTSDEACRRIITLWKRKDLATKENFRRIFREMEFRSDAVEIIQHLKKKGLKICLITGSMDMYAEVIAERLGVDQYYSNAKLYWNTDDTIDKFTYSVHQSKVKLEQFEGFLKDNNLKPNECAVVGDSSNDYGLFELTRRGIAIKSEYEDVELESIAWRVIGNLSEIKNIL